MQVFVHKNIALETLGKDFQRKSDKIFSCLKKTLYNKQNNQTCKNANNWTGFIDNDLFEGKAVILCKMSHTSIIHNGNHGLSK